MLKIACFGYVEKDSGSVSGANYLILDELLNRGFEIDFFSSDSPSQLADLVDRERMRFVSLPNKAFYREFIRQKLPQKLQGPFNKNVGALMQNLYSRRRDKKCHQAFIAAEHQHRQYDLMLFLGLYAPFKIETLPVVSWVQGPPQTEWEHIHRLKDKVIELCGAYMYTKMAIFYAIKNRRTAVEIDYNDVFICGSQWSVQQLVRYGIDRGAIHALPYPIDTNLFRPAPARTDTQGKKSFLWLGRIDPRKRFDLMLEAFALLVQERQDVCLKIYGKSRFPGYLDLMNRFPYPDHIEYTPHIDRPAIPDLLRSVAAVVQPSEGENFGSSVAEALCCGVPSIMGPTNGTQEYVGSSAFLFGEYTPESVKQTLLAALDALETSGADIARAARQTAEETLSLETVVDQLVRILQQAVPASSNRGERVPSSAMK